MGIELNRPAIGQPRLGKSLAPANPLDGLGASDASNGFADMMSQLAKDPVQLPATDLALGDKVAGSGTAASFAATAHRSTRTSKTTDLEALMSAVTPIGSKDVAAGDGVADILIGAGTQPTPDGFLTPPSAQNPTAQSWQDLLLGGSMAGASGAARGMLGVASVQPNPTPTSLDPKAGLPQAVMPAVTGIAAAGTSAQSALSTLASRQQSESVVADTNPRLLVTNAVMPTVTRIAAAGTSAQSALSIPASRQQPASVVADTNPRLLVTNAVTPALTGTAAAGTSVQSALSTPASRLQPESSSSQSTGQLRNSVPVSLANQTSSQVAPDANPRLFVTKAVPSAWSSEPAPVMAQVLAGLTVVPTAQPVLGPDRSVAAGVVPSDRTPQPLSSTPLNLPDPSTSVATSVLSKPASPSDAAPVASGSGAPPALTDGVPVNTSHKVDLTELVQPEQPKALTPPSATGASAAAGSVSQRLDPSQMAVHQALIAPAILDANAVLARVDQPLVPVAENTLKPLAKRLGWGSESLYGQTAAVVNPLVDTAFQVAPTTAVVADGALAETVSYWAANGVQNATMQLDGLGSEPVEVSISMKGDMAQVDFRTNQVAVQQVIEAAAGQLKDMLMSQGLQLAGLSIGQSGLGGQADKGQKQAGEVKKIAMIDSQPVLEPQTGRSVNLSVGQSLDLFV
jgi:flagellar hook-length control protein FliK